MERQTVLSLLWLFVIGTAGFLLLPATFMLLSPYFLLGLLCFLTYWTYARSWQKLQFLWFVACSSAALWIVEVVGVATGYPFGTYTYGSSLGVVFLGAPLLIGFLWCLVVLGCADISREVSDAYWVRVLVTALLATLADVVLEAVAPLLGFWSFSSHPGIANYLSWFVLSGLMGSVVHRFDWRLGLWREALVLQTLMFLVIGVLA